MPSAPKRTWIIIAFAATYLIWGSTYLAIFYAIQSIPPFLMAGSRFLLAGVIMCGTARLQGTSWPPPISWKSALIIGACLLVGGNGAVTIAEKWVPTGLAALLVATIPIYIALLGWITGSAPRPAPVVWLGLFGGLVGVGVLVGPALTNLATASPQSHLALGMSILLGGSLAWSAGSLYSRTAKSSPSLFMAAGQQMICGGGLLFLLGLARDEHHGFNPGNVSSLSMGAFIYLVLIGALVGYTAYFWLLRHCEPAKVATYAYVNPIVAMILGTVFGGEILSARTLLAAALIIGSVALVITAQQLKKAQESPASPAVPELGCVR
jgi:drug/metabolite transporter (DMT)-like permease